MNFLLFFSALFFVLFIGAVVIQGFLRIKELALTSAAPGPSDKPRAHFSSASTFDNMTEIIPWPSEQPNQREAAFSPLPWPSQVYGILQSEASTRSTVNEHMPLSKPTSDQNNASNEQTAEPLNLDFFNDPVPNTPVISHSQIIEWREQFGLSGTIDLIRQETGWSFKEAADFVIEQSDAQVNQLT